MSGSSARSCTPSLRTASLGVEGWAVSTAEFVSMDDMQQLYSLLFAPEDHNRPIHTAACRAIYGGWKATIES